MRPANYNAVDSEIELAEELTEQYSGEESPVLEPNRKSHFEIIAEPADGASNRKSSKEVTPRSSNCYRWNTSKIISRPQSSADFALTLFSGQSYIGRIARWSLR